jgi:hypothetical protein
MGQLSIADSGSVKTHEQIAMKGSVSHVDASRICRGKRCSDNPNLREAAMATGMSMLQPAFPPALEATLFGWEGCSLFLVSPVRPSEQGPLPPCANLNPTDLGAFVMRHISHVTCTVRRPALIIKNRTAGLWFTQWL